MLCISQNRLAIIPNATHYDIFYSPLLLTTVLPFLDGADRRAGTRSSEARVSRPSAAGYP